METSNRKKKARFNSSNIYQPPSTSESNLQPLSSSSNKFSSALEAYSKPTNVSNSFSVSAGGVNFTVVDETTVDTNTNAESGVDYPPAAAVGDAFPQYPHASYSSSTTSQHHNSLLASTLDTALNDMLMAWYHSGYATGRYQTLLEVQQQQQQQQQQRNSTDKEDA